MAEKSTYIKIDRNILNWRWYKDANTTRLFIHLLLKANIKDHGFRNTVIKRGEVATSYASLAEELDMSIKNVRTSLEHLKETGEVAVCRHSRFTVISMPRYDYYQTQVADKRQASGNQVAIKWQQSKNEKNERMKEEREHAARAGVSPSLDEVIAYRDETGLDVDPEAFWNFYEGSGWTRKGDPIRNWKAVFRSWKGKENYTKAATPSSAADEALRKLEEKYGDDTQGGTRNL